MPETFAASSPLALQDGGCFASGDVDNPVVMHHYVVVLHPDLPLHDDITNLQAENETRLVNLQKAGLPVGVNRAAAILEFLLDETLGTTTGRRAGWEMSWQRQIAADLDEAEAELRRQQIMNGVK